MADSATLNWGWRRAGTTACRADERTKRPLRYHHSCRHDMPCARSTPLFFSLSLSLSNEPMPKWSGRWGQDLPKSYMHRREKSARLGGGG